MRETAIRWWNQSNFSKEKITFLVEKHLPNRPFGIKFLTGREIQLIYEKELKK